MKNLYIPLVASLFFAPPVYGVTFSFEYFDYDTGFLDPVEGKKRQRAMERAANIFGRTALGAYDAEIHLALSGNGRSGILAAAGPEIASDPPGGGFGRPNVVREKILTQGAVDLNGDYFDAFIEVNFDDNDWQLDLGQATGAYQYDFYDTIYHELVHTLGWVATFDLETGANLVGDGLAGSGRPGEWSVYDSLITNGDGRFLIDRNTFENTQSDIYDLLATNYYYWDPAGLYFGGENAVAAFGG